MVVFNVYLQHPSYVLHVVDKLVHVQIPGFFHLTFLMLVYVYGAALVVAFAFDVRFCEVHLQVWVHIFCFAVQLRDFLWDIFLDSLFLYKPRWNLSHDLLWHLWEAPCLLVHHHPSAVSSWSRQYRMIKLEDDTEKLWFEFWNQPCCTCKDVTFCLASNEPVSPHSILPWRSYPCADFHNLSPERLVHLFISHD